jgi:hypothetical protein
LDLDIEKVKYFTFTEFKKRSFFQNACSEIITDLIIPPNDLNFLYPYSYGHYIYLVKRNEFLDVESCLSTWINNCFPNRFRDIDNLYAGQVSDRFNFFDNENFILTTNYDHNTDIGIVLKSNKAQETVEWLKKQTEILGIFDFELETFDNCHRTRVIN